MGRETQPTVKPFHRVFILAACGFMLLFSATCGGNAKSPADTPEVRAFLTRYFSSWSAKDMDTYGACFDPEARILFVTGSGQILSQGTMDFLHGQKMAHEQSATPMNEQPQQMTIQGDAKVVQAAVTWILKKGDKEERGTDFFTLRRQGDGWKIVSLVFYGE